MNGQTTPATTSFKMLSWGCGTQSTALAAMSAVGAFDLPKLDAVITADTGWERAATYEIQHFYTKWLTDRGIPVYVVSAGNVKEQGAHAHIHMPFWTASGGPLRRQCTSNFKIKPIKAKVRELIGYTGRGRPPVPGTVDQWLGITLDEYQRMKSSGVKYIVNRYPLVMLKLTRGDCIQWLSEQGLPVPIKSACIGCPYRSASEWLDMRDRNPDEFAEAAEFDERNRHNPLAQRAGSTADEIFLHRSLQPLNIVSLETWAAKERQKNGFQLPMLLECDSGYCHV